MRCQCPRSSASSASRRTVVLVHRSVCSDSFNGSGNVSRTPAPSHVTAITPDSPQPIEPETPHERKSHAGSGRYAMNRHRIDLIWFPVRAHCPAASISRDSDLHPRDPQLRHRTGARSHNGCAESHTECATPHVRERMTDSGADHREDRGKSPGRHTLHWPLPQFPPRRTDALLQHACVSWQTSGLFAGQDPGHAESEHASANVRRIPETVS